MRRFLQFTWLETKLYFRVFYSPFFAIAFPIMILLLFGSIFGNTPDEFFGGYGAADLTTATAIGIVIVVNGIMSLPMSLAVYRSRKILKRFRATPASPLLLMSAQFVVNFVMTLVGAALLVVVGKLAFGARHYGGLLPFAGAVVLTILSIFSLGLVIASLAPSEKAANIIGNLVYFPMVFLSGATLPAQMFPEGLRKVTQIFPLTHGVTIIKGVWLGGNLSDFPTELIILAATTIVFTVIAVLTFRWE
jgi:ABC-2 type transport system permease protein